MEITIFPINPGGNGSSVVIVDVGATVDLTKGTVPQVQYCTRSTLLYVVIKDRLPYQWKDGVRPTVR